ncbi:MAG: DUF177 domain-containing protein [bacterium]|nr:DUF177 domain-containing protein [bacterium]
MDEKKFSIDMREILSGEVGKLYKYKLSGHLSSEDEIKYISPVIVKLDIVNIDKTINAKGNIETEIELICSRCGRGFNRHIDLQFERIFEEDLDADDVLSSDGIVDFEPIVREEIILSLPIQILCKKNCRGLLR